MYRKPNGQLTIDDFKLPFEGKLRADNRWVGIAQLVPWDEIEQEYAKLFENDIGNVAKPARMALGALIIKEKCGYSDIETVEQIKENPYLCPPGAPQSIVQFGFQCKLRKLWNCSSGRSPYFMVILTRHATLWTIWQFLLRDLKSRTATRPITTPISVCSY